MLFNSKLFSVFLITSEIAEVIVEESVYSYVKYMPNGGVVVKFPENCTHGIFPDHASALEEIARIWFLMREAEMTAGMHSAEEHHNEILRTMP